jgi:hypothetical protein
MPIKRLLCLKRLRRIPRQFSWIDQRLVRERYIERCDAQALALYLLLLTVADAQGLSYYSDRTMCRLLSMAPAHLEQARATLIRASLIAHEAPLYQVLGLDAAPAAVPACAAGSAPPSTGPESIGAALARLQRHFPDRMR